MSKLLADYEPVQESLKEKIENVYVRETPRHVGVIMDGNRRWARLNHKSLKAGYEQGVAQLDEVVLSAIELNITTLTVYALSTENWQRPAGQIRLLMYLLERYLIEKRTSFMEYGIKVSIIGDLSKFSSKMRKIMDETVRLTINNDQINLVLALNYGGRDEIRRAILDMQLDVKKGVFDWKDLTEEIIADYLDTVDFPDPELIIRSSGDSRLSNFLIWQGAYSEIYMSDVYWPEFSKEHFFKAILFYQDRIRRFGG